MEENKESSSVIETPQVANTPQKESEIPTLREHLENAWDLVKFAALALAIVIPVRLFIAQPFVVSGDSMVPTFHDKEYLIIDEISYITGEPHRGDVIVFRYPGDPSRFFIKRIIGMPNEKITFKNGEVTITNAQNKETLKLVEPYLNEAFGTSGTFTTGINEYFVLGDNRNRSSDSRSWGILPRKNIIGRAYLRLYPFDEMDYLPGSYREEIK